MTNFRPALVHAQSWWFAALLARRHPDLMLREAHPRGDADDCLDLHDVCVPIDEQPYVSINRAGTLRFPRTGANPWPLDRLFTEQPEGLVEQAETAAGLAAPDGTPDPTPRTLVYRTVAALTGITANDRRPWEVRDPSLIPSSRDDLYARFPLAAERAREHLLYVVRRAGETIGALDTDGYAYVGRGCHYLPEVDQQHARHLHRTVAAVFGGLLQ
ncbi:TY-Chap2 family putative peptide chaperone [Couchioplanes caeruleus]|uniref:T3SS peptide-binding chaperone domain-containing protein n=2 Tax=Couchioplanes caeruleus TaxID=56438 RepID=A0A1K0GGS8_9ACTN|nr:hypothetical protein [Couchioplanes caeruleus]OJF10076.1 hypothetical protein BG844_34090 [Couchioplanes caeruleus subsp. caeruleus]ROP31377.1 hypothetical protein EDD30_4277 [Couchioplanes caeruleus]